MSEEGGIRKVKLSFSISQRENDLLKEQLKLMVQRRDSALHSGDAVGMSL